MAKTKSENSMKGGRARAAALTPEERTSIAQKAAQARWGSIGDVREFHRSEMERMRMEIEEMRESVRAERAATAQEVYMIRASFHAESEQLNARLAEIRDAEKKWAAEFAAMAQMQRQNILEDARVANAIREHLVRVPKGQVGGE